jgi:hypothetical protein
MAWPISEQVKTRASGSGREPSNTRHLSASMAISQLPGSGPVVATWTVTGSEAP